MLFDLFLLCLRLNMALHSLHDSTRFESVSSFQTIFFLLFVLRLELLFFFFNFIFLQICNVSPTANFVARENKQTKLIISVVLSFAAILNHHRSFFYSGFHFVYFSVLVELVGSKIHENKITFSSITKRSRVVLNSIGFPPTKQWNNEIAPQQWLTCECVCVCGVVCVYVQ